MAKAKKSLLIALDGLSFDDTRMLFRQLPKFAAVCGGSSALLDTSPFTAAQPIWAEILTGQPWWQNGCTAYARPVGSLNSLQPVTEKDLFVPIKIVDTTSDSIAINVPLLLPLKDGRVWLSDGSLPLNKYVSPLSLSQEEPFSSYKPRPFTDAATASQNQRKNLEAAIEVEALRLRCAMQLILQHTWSKMVYRISLFDLMSHALGLGFLDASSDLACWNCLDEFLRQLDVTLHSICTNSEINWMVVSAFGHSPCRGTASLNHILQSKGYLGINYNSEPDARESMRSVIGNVSVENSKHRTDSFSTEGRLKLSVTQAASPVSGCVYINDQRTFEKGIVTADSFDATADEIEICLRTLLTDAFGDGCMVVRKPSGTKFDTGKAVATPEFVVHIPDVEMTDVQVHQRNCDKPRTTHSTQGFVISPANVPCGTKLLKPFQLSSMLVTEEKQLF